MRIDAVVINASPLITLFRSGQGGLLPSLFKHIVVPEAVWREVVVQGQGDRAARELRGCENIPPSPPANVARPV